jgi:diguanylate cyclase (GGDEF)-like protein
VPRQQLYLLCLSFGLPALVVSWLLLGSGDPVTRYGWPPLALHLLVCAWLLLRRPHLVAQVERSTLVVVAALLLSRTGYHLFTQTAEQAWADLNPSAPMVLVLLVVFGYMVFGTAGGLRWSLLLVTLSTAVAVVALLPEARETGQWTVLGLTLRSAVYVSVTAVFVHALARVKDEAADARVEATRMRDLAHHDALTGLPNRRRAQDLLGLHVATGSELAVVSLDLDRFKAVNDEHGHAAGDVVLHDVAVALRQAVPPGVTVTRWGGEEFLVLCPGMPPAQAHELGEQLRRAVAACPLPHHLQLTASVGLTCRRPEDDTTSLLRRVDDLMYAAKTSGRDAVRADVSA